MSKQCKIHSEWFPYLNKEKSVRENLKVLQDLGFKCNRDSVNQHLKMMNPNPKEIEIKEEDSDNTKTIKQVFQTISTMNQQESTSKRYDDIDTKMREASKFVLTDEVYDRLKRFYIENFSNLNLVREFHNRSSLLWIKFTQADMGQRDWGLITTSQDFKESHKIWQLCVLSYLYKDIRNGEWEVPDKRISLTPDEEASVGRLNRIFNIVSEEEALESELAELELAVAVA